MKKCNVIVVIIAIILIIVVIYMYFNRSCDEPCHCSWNAVVEVEPVTIDLVPDDTIYTIYTVTVTTDRELILDITGTGFTNVTARPLIPEAIVSPGETVLYDSLEIIVDAAAVPSTGIVCAVVNERGYDIPSFKDCIPIIIVAP
jgi:hypothetical protein